DPAEPVRDDGRKPLRGSESGEPGRRLVHVRGDDQERHRPLVSQTSRAAATCQAVRASSSATAGRASAGMNGSPGGTVPPSPSADPTGIPLHHFGGLGVLAGFRHLGTLGGLASFGAFLSFGILAALGTFGP